MQKVCQQPRRCAEDHAGNHHGDPSAHRPLKPGTEACSLATELLFGLRHRASRLRPGTDFMKTVDYNITHRLRRLRMAPFANIVGHGSGLAELSRGSVSTTRLKTENRP